MRKVSCNFLRNLKIPVKASYRRRIFIDVCTIGQVDEDGVHILYVCNSDGKIGQSGEGLGFILVLKKLQRKKCWKKIKRTLINIQLNEWLRVLALPFSSLSQDLHLEIFHIWPLAHLSGYCHPWLVLHSLYTPTPHPWRFQLLLTCVAADWPGNLVLLQNVCSDTKLRVLH